MLTPRVLCAARLCHSNLFGESTNYYPWKWVFWLVVVVVDVYSETSWSHNIMEKRLRTNLALKEMGLGLSVHNLFWRWSRFKIHSKRLRKVTNAETGIEILGLVSDHVWKRNLWSLQSSQNFGKAAVIDVFRKSDPEIFYFGFIPFQKREFALFCVYCISKTSKPWRAKMTLPRRGKYTLPIAGK